MKNTFKYILIACFFLATSGCKNTTQKKHTVKSGPFKASITETGELHAIRSKMIPMPFIGWKYGWRYKVIHLAKHGQRIDVGDTIVMIDPSPVLKVLEEQRNKLESEEANLKKLYAKHQSALSQLISEQQSEEANLSLIMLQVDKFKFESENKRQLKKLELDIAKTKVDNIKEKNKQKKIVFDNEIQIQKIKIRQIQKNILEGEHALKQLVILSPVKGIVQLEKNRRTGSMVQIGDDIHMGAYIASIPDMSKMKVVSAINEADIRKIHLGQDVIIRLDAYPEKSFEGKIKYIGRLCREKERDSPLRVFDFEVEVKGKDDALKPGMTVSSELIFKELDNSLYIENECIFTDGSDYFVIKEGTDNKIPIEILAVNSHYSAIQGNIEKGQRLISMEELSVKNLKENK